jgi:hypothetical protein
MELFQIGDEVRWAFRGVIREGTIVGVVGANHRAGEIPEDFLRQYILAFSINSPKRPDESYLVKVVQKHEKNKPKLHWPNSEFLVLVCRPEKPNANVS